jgi:predicted RNA-binding protein with PUA domain
MNDAVNAFKNANAAKDSVIVAKESIVMNQEFIIEGKDLEIVGLKTALKKESRKLKWTKIGWAGTSVVFTGIIAAILLK